MKELGDNMTITKPRKKSPINPHISLVKRWLVGEDISVDALWANSEAADAADAGWADDDAAWAAAEAAAAAKFAATARGHATYWVKRYEELTK